MSEMDYQVVIALALQDSTGNGLRAESAARFAQAMLFYEATLARDKAKQSGFPLTILTNGETFTLTTAASALLAMMGPSVDFSRSEAKITVNARYVAPAALGCEENPRVWTSIKASSATIQKDAQSLVGWAVSMLARNFSLTQK